MNKLTKSQSDRFDKVIRIVLVKIMGDEKTAGEYRKALKTTKQYLADELVFERERMLEFCLDFFSTHSLNTKVGVPTLVIEKELAKQILLEKQNE